MYDGPVYCEASPQDHLIRRGAQLLDLGCSPEYTEKIIADLRPRLVQVVSGRRRPILPLFTSGNPGLADEARRLFGGSEEPVT